MNELYPGTKFGIGPHIANGFYYDMELPAPLHEGDLLRIEEKMREIAKGNHKFERFALSREEARREAMIALERVGLQAYARSYPHVLSGGEQQRVALARALAPRPAVLLMDEPFSGLDSRLKDSVRAETLGILRHTRATAMVVTHDAEEAMRMGDRIALLKDGRLKQTGRAEELYLEPADLFVAGFFSELNVFEVRARAGVAETPVGKVEAASFADGTPLHVAIRTSGFDVSETSGEAEARILSRRYLGVVELLDLAVSGAETPVRARVRCAASRPCPPVLTCCLPHVQIPHTRIS